MRLSTFVLGTAVMLGAVKQTPHPFPVPRDMSGYFGDADRGPEPRKSQKGKYQMPLGPVMVNRGHPVRDYGHFRLKKHVYNYADNRKHGFQLARNGYDPGKSFDKFENKAWKDGKLLRYSIAQPPDGAQRPRGGWPLVIFAPGSGAVGEKHLGRVKKKGDPALQWVSDYYQRHYPAVVLRMHPQQRTVHYENFPDRPTETTTTEVLDAYFELIDALLKQRRDIDRDRIYIAGFSMGGSSVWQMMLKRPMFFAAASPGAGQPLHDPKEAKIVAEGGTPIWMFMGNQDPWSGSMWYIGAYQALTKAGHERVRFWEVQDMGHSEDCMHLVPVAAWMFDQSRHERRR